MCYLKSKDTVVDRRVRIEAPARLHLGFIDLNGDLGRRFGSLGVALEGISTQIVIEKSDAFNGTGPGSERAIKYAEQFYASLRLGGGAQITVLNAIPEHVGLGSGTQLALAIGVAIDKLYHLRFDVNYIAALLARGRRSGIGIGVFDQGGFIVDGGRGAGARLPPVISRVTFPEHWRVLLLFDERGRGLHGRDEFAAFETLPSFPAEDAAKLSRITLMRILPALSEQDWEQFGLGIGELQGVIGDYFLPVQGGRFTSPAVAKALEWMKTQGVAGVGQSSWGPTGFAIIDSETRAHSLLRQLKKKFGERKPLRYQVVKARNSGKVMTVDDGNEMGRIVRSNHRVGTAHNAT